MSEKKDINICKLTRDILNNCRIDALHIIPNADPQIFIKEDWIRILVSNIVKHILLEVKE